MTPYYVKNAAPPETGRKEYWDAKAPGLALRVTNKNARSWIYMGRLFGKQLRLTLGAVDALSLADARLKAMEAYRLMATGDDPRIIWGKEKALKKHAALDKPITLSECYDEYINRHAQPKLKSFPTINRVMQRHILPHLGRTPADNIKKADFMRITDQLIAQGHGTMANRVLA